MTLFHPCAHCGTLISAEESAAAYCCADCQLRFAAEHGYTLPPRTIEEIKQLDFDEIPF